MSSTQTPVGGSSQQNKDKSSIRSTARPSLAPSKYSCYRKTPGSRRIGVTQRTFPRTPEEETEPPCLTGLISTTWHTYKVTPLYNFKSEARYFKKYGRLLSAFIEAERRKGDAIEIGAESPDKVELSHYPGLKVSQDDPPAFQIIMRCHNKFGNGTLKTVLTAYFLGVEMEKSLEPHLQETFLHYPVVLVRGSASHTRFMFDWLKSQFDCSVSRLVFSSLDMTWILTMWSGQLTGGISKPVELKYTLPAGCDGLDKITMRVDAEDCKEVWDCIHDKQYDDITTEEVTAFITCLENHFYRHFKIKLSASQLASVGTALAFVAAEGKLKLLSEDKALSILRDITCFAMEQLGLYSQ